MKTPAKEFGIWNVRTTLRPQLIKEYHNSKVQHTCMSLLYGRPDGKGKQ
jgi:hypothetical protein